LVADPLGPSGAPGSPIGVVVEAVEIRIASPLTVLVASSAIV
jgi:hypothetical protein